MDAISTGHLNISDDEIGLEEKRGVVTTYSVLGHGHLIAALLERHAQQFARFVVVFDNQNSLGHTNIRRFPH